MLEKKEEFLTKKIGEEMQKARANATSNKRCKRFLGHLLIAISYPQRLAHYRRFARKVYDLFGQLLTMNSGHGRVEAETGA